MQERIQLGAVTVSRGERGFGFLNICRMADGGDLKIPIHVIAGAKPGPTLVLTATQHGDEVGPITVFKELVSRLNPSEMIGSVVLMPVLNPIAFEMGQRSTWVDGQFDGTTGNMNRLWPGNPQGFVTERIVAAVASEVLSKADYVIDFHGSTSSSLSVYYSYLMPGDGSIGTVARELVTVFGMEIIMRRPGRQVGSAGMSLADFAYNELKIPAFVCELGDFYGLEPERAARPAEDLRRSVPEVGVTGVLNVMKYLKMIPGQFRLPCKQVIVSPETRCQPSAGGILVPEVTRQDIGCIFPRGAVLGRVFSPFTLDELDVIRAPYEANILCSARDLTPCSKTSPGDQGFHVADWQTAEWIEH
jgi:predicted deacylase